ncbi:MAG: agmatinase [Candidatus Nezhaarchaeales archaeon]
MSAIDLYVARMPYRFFELENDPNEAELVLLGFPYDSTSSFRVGSRFAPQQLRIYSAAIEGYVWELEVEISDVRIADAGDIIVIHGDTVTSLNRLKEVVQAFRSLKKKVGVVGGEHTLTLGSVHGCNPKSLIIFDAHLDLREEYPYGQKLSHATWLRRLLEEHSCEVVVAGVKATSREELENAKKMDLTYLTYKQMKKSKMKALDGMLSTLSDPLYVSVDIDVLDPAYAPGVATPEPLGFTLQELLDGLWYLKDREILGFDVVEVCPPYDNGSTCISACKILMDLSIMSLSKHNLVE